MVILLSNQYDQQVGFYMQVIANSAFAVAFEKIDPDQSGKYNIVGGYTLEEIMNGSILAKLENVDLLEGLIKIHQMMIDSEK